MNEQEVRKYLEERNKTFEELEEWLEGQTVGINEDGTIDYYEWDLKRFTQE